MNRLFALACLLLAALGALDARSQTAGTLYNTDGSTTQFTYVGQVSYGPGGLTVSGVTKAAPSVTGGIGYATPADTVGPGFNAWQITRPVENSDWTAVGAQINAWCYAGTRPCFAGATESINWSTTDSFNQIGWEAGIVNFSPSSSGYKVGLNTVIKCQMDDAYANGANPCATPNNLNSYAVLVTSQLGTGWQSGIIFGYHSIDPHGAAIDFSSLGNDRDAVLFKLPDGRPVTASQFAALFK